MGSITIIPKENTELKKKKPRPQTLEWNMEYLHEVKMYAEDTFWADWIKNRFDLALIRIFYSQVGQLTYGEEIKITDGKSVIIGKRTDRDMALLTNGYKMKGVYGKEWAEEKGFVYAPQYQVRINIDHKGHFLKRYKKRGFDLRLVAAFIGKVAQAKLGQKVKMISDEEIIVGKRLDAGHAVLITGMVRGEIDWDDYVDIKIDV